MCEDECIKAGKYFICCVKFIIGIVIKGHCWSLMKEPHVHGLGVHASLLCEVIAGILLLYETGCLSTLRTIDRKDHWKIASFISFLAHLFAVFYCELGLDGRSEVRELEEKMIKSVLFELIWMIILGCYKCCKTNSRESLLPF